MRRTLLIAGLGCILLASSSRGAEEGPVFETAVQPILSQKCGKCHSEQVRKGGLDLSSLAGLLQGGESGEPLVGAGLGESHLWGMIDGGGMPPAGEPPLTDLERDLIRQWLLTGARALHPAANGRRELTQHDVLPIVLLRCTTCHGPRRRDGGLDLRTPTSMRQGGRSGQALVPGDPQASLMLQRIESEACPPADGLLKFFVKRPTRSEVETLRQWIAAGAPDVEIPADVATTAPDPLVTDADRQHWAFQPPRKPAGAASLDALIEARLHEHGLTFSPPADRETLIRRAFFDLIGLPPSPDEWRHWRNCADPDWYGRMIETLLASPHYGERWGQYWLDVAGYADSEGGTSADPVREVAWKYRDYVIRAFNDDKPYDRFLLEQLAGDELVDYDRAEVITEDMVANLVATGFLRMGIDQTGSRTMNYVPERLGVIHDALAVLGSGVLGLTLECARCHSHKYDPIPQRDYYRLKAIFQGALDEHDWLTFQTRQLEVATPEHRARVAAVNPPLQRELKSLAAKLRQATATAQLEVLRHHYPDQPEAERAATLAALKVADNTRTLPQRILVEMLQEAELRPDSEQSAAVLEAREEVRRLEAQILDLQRQLEPPLAIRALWDRGEPSPTYLLLRGEHDRPGRLVGPGVPSVLTDGRTPFVIEPPFPGGTPKTGRRLALARWLIHPDHPLTARVMVNRIWHHHFGAGLVRTLENFGAQGEPPSHPELLDWLAVEFVERGWSVKELHRLIMNSRTYQQASRVTPDAFARDPQNRWLSRMPLRRLDAEALRDALLYVSGKLDDTPGGPPDPVLVEPDGMVNVVPTQRGGWRRSIYLQHRRTEMPTMLETFDYPEMGPNCVSRSLSTVSPQPLLLRNNAHVRDLARALAGRVREHVQRSQPTVDANGSEASLAFGERRDHVTTPPPSSREDLVQVVYQLALSREPSPAELDLGTAALQRLAADWGGDHDSALVTYCHAILNSAPFLYVD